MGGVFWVYSISNYLVNLTANKWPECEFLVFDVRENLATNEVFSF